MEAEGYDEGAGGGEEEVVRGEALAIRDGGWGGGWRADRESAGD